MKASLSSRAKKSSAGILSLRCLGMYADRSSAAGLFAKHAQNAFLGLNADGLVDELAVFESKNRGDAHDAELGSEFLFFVHIHFADLHISNRLSDFVMGVICYFSFYSSSPIWSRTLYNIP